jgi:hypothetical protein
LSPAPRTSLLGHLDFRSFSNHSVATSRAKIRAKMAAPVRADIRMSRPETPKNILGNEPRNDGRDRRHAEGSQNVYDPIIHPKPARRNVTLGADRIGSATSKPCRLTRRG